MTSFRQLNASPDASEKFQPQVRKTALMAWFTGNIGYHHVHHLNHRIPFYRLPETCRAIPELQKATTTSLYPLDIIRCLCLKVWSVETQRMVGVRDL